jgi:alcohol dehydrogenase, propanol-preferring
LVHPARDAAQGGCLVLVALPAAGTLRIPVFDTVLNGTSVIGSIIGTGRIGQR